MSDLYFKWCEVGFLADAEIYLSNNENIDISECNKHVEFCYACKTESLEYCQMLLHINPDINISIQNETAFRLACGKGRLEVCQWLLQIKPDIDISANNEHAFAWACFNRNLEVCKWLLLVKPDIDISVEYELPFRLACGQRHLEVAQWLQSLKPYSYVIYYNEDGTYKDYYIITKEERWQKRKYLVWLRSNKSPNKESIIYRLPEDVSRHIIGFV